MEELLRPGLVAELIEAIAAIRTFLNCFPERDPAAAGGRLTARRSSRPGNMAAGPSNLLMTLQAAGSSL
jgi:hypothetical protein